MAIVIRMPEVLAGAAEAVISQWMIQEGQDVAVGDTLAEIETEKANVDYQAEEQGTLARVLIKPGETVEVGAPIAVFAAAGDTDEDIEAALAAVGQPRHTPPHLILIVTGAGAARLLALLPAHAHAAAAAREG